MTKMSQSKSQALVIATISSAKLSYYDKNVILLKKHSIMRHKLYTAAKRDHFPTFERNRSRTMTFLSYFQHANSEIITLSGANNLSQTSQRDNKKPEPNSQKSEVHGRFMVRFMVKSAMILLFYKKNPNHLYLFQNVSSCAHAHVRAYIIGTRAPTHAPAHTRAPHARQRFGKDPGGSWSIG